MRFSFVLLSALLLVVSSCNKEKECSGTSSRTYSFDNFNKIAAGSNLSITVVKGQACGVAATGCAADLDKLTFDLHTGLLQIGFTPSLSQRAPIEVTVTVPVLASVQLSGNAQGNITGFEGQHSNIRTVLSENASCTLSGTGINTQVDLSGNARLTVSGTTENLYGNLAGNSKLEAYGLSSTEVDISLTDKAKGYVLPLQQLFVAASGESQLYYKGNPATKVTELSDKAKVIHE